MGIFKKIKKALKINIFYLIAFTITIFSFSLGNSIVYNEKLAGKKYVSGNVQSISVSSSHQLTIREIESIVKDYPVSLWASFADNSTGYLISSELIKNKFSVIPNLKEGRDFTKEEQIGDKNIAIVSSATGIKENFDILSMDNNKYNLTPIGNYYGILNEVFIPKKAFMNMLKDDVVNNKPIFIWLGGNESDISECVLDIKKYLLTIDENSNLEAFKGNSFIPISKGNIFSKISFNILFICIINSFILSTVWVEKRKKELALRKAVGATDKQLSNLFLKELSIITLISAILALVGYFILVILTEGFILNLDIRPSLFSIVSGLALILATSYLVSYFLLSKLRKMEAMASLGRE